MPLGDSITYDSFSGDPRPPGFRTGYRQILWNFLWNAGYDVDFVGSQIAGQDVLPSFDPDNAGFPGITAKSLANLLQTGYWSAREEEVSPGPYLESYPADLILLHVGTNWVQASEVDGIERILNIIDAYDSAHAGHDTEVVIARIINQDPWNTWVTDFNDLLEAMVIDRINNGDRLTLVDMEDQAGFSYVIGYDMRDTVHPLNPGYAKMAGLWMKALANLLPAPPHRSPGIFSVPGTYGYAGQVFHYQVVVEGYPLAGFQLLEAPSGMVIDSETGLIEWVPKSMGTYDVIVEASNYLGSDSQEFQVNIEDGPLPIIDNDQPGTRANGTWELSSGLEYYETQSLFSNTAGDTYSFKAFYSGTAEIFLWWTNTVTRCDDVPVFIYDGPTLVSDSIRINQLSDGGRWNPVGTYTFTSGAIEVVILSSGTCSTNADAVRILPTLAKGDFNADSTVGLHDCILALQICVLVPTGVDIDLRADTNDDQKIGIQDAIYVLQFLVDKR